jgi:predicted peptidase
MALTPERLHGFDCIVSRPPSFEQQESWPVLVFLHGRDECKPFKIADALTLHGPLSPQSASEAVEQFLIIAPQLDSPGGDVCLRHAAALMNIVQDATRLYRGDARRAYLTGFSFGGNGVLDVGLMQPNVWAALWAVDPTRVPQQAPARPLWVSAGKYANPNQPAFRAIGLQESSEPADRNTADRVFFFTGTGHSTTARTAYADPGIYQWLLRKSLS